MSARGMTIVLQTFIMEIAKFMSMENYVKIMGNTALPLSQTSLMKW